MALVEVQRAAAKALAVMARVVAAATVRGLQGVVAKAAVTPAVQPAV